MTNNTKEHSRAIFYLEVGTLLLGDAVMRRRAGVVSHFYQAKLETRTRVWGLAMGEHETGKE